VSAVAVPRLATCPVAAGLAFCLYSNGFLDMAMHKRVPATSIYSRVHILGAVCSPAVSSDSPDGIGCHSP
jgi:hypothetical protein